VHGDPSKLAAVRDHLFAESIFPVAPLFLLEPLDDSTPLAAGGRLTHFPLAHPGGSLGFRLEWPAAGKSLAYVTDTTAAADAHYVERIRGVDLLLHECNFADNTGNYPRLTGHSWLMPVAEVAAAAEVGRLVLVHIGPQYESDDAFDLAAARRVFAETELAMDGMELEV
jgi:ribonuclease BN (tRNA processing enzyme)